MIPAKQALILHLLTQKPMSTRELAQAFNLQGFEDYHSWTVADLSPSLKTLAKKTKIQRRRLREDRHHRITWFVTFNNG